jgi:hypothetical protein
LSLLPPFILYLLFQSSKNFIYLFISFLFHYFSSFLLTLYLSIYPLLSSLLH